MVVVIKGFARPKARILLQESEKIKRMHGCKLQSADNKVDVV